MPTPTLTERVNQLTNLVSALSGKVDRLAETTSTDGEKLQDDLRELRQVAEELGKELNSAFVTDARHDERLKSLEKWHDRAFQIAPMVISAAGVVIALIALFVKK